MDGKHGNDTQRYVSNVGNVPDEVPILCPVQSRIVRVLA